MTKRKSPNSDSRKTPRGKPSPHDQKSMTTIPCINHKGTNCGLCDGTGEILVKK